MALPSGDKDDLMDVSDSQLCAAAEEFRDEDSNRYELINFVTKSVVTSKV